MYMLTVPANFEFTRNDGTTVAVRFVEDVLFGHVLAGQVLRDDPVTADNLAQLFTGKGPGDGIRMLDELFEKGKRAFLHPEPDYGAHMFPSILKFHRAWAEAKASAEETK